MEHTTDYCLTARSEEKRRWWHGLAAEGRFIRHLIALNLASAMEYRASFISQIVGMMLNNGIMLLFWFIFFEQFGNVRGYGFRQLFLLYGIVALAYGLAHMVAGNVAQHLAYLIAQGRLDYYLVFPRNLLAHVIFSRMQISAIGDLTFGLLACVVAVPRDWVSVILLMAAVVLATLIITAYGIVAGSLSFFIGNAQNASMQMMSSLVTFSLYPNSLFSGLARFLLFTLIPAGFVGAVPVSLIQTHDVVAIVWLATATFVSWLLAVTIFYAGLRRYESGSAININI